MLRAPGDDDELFAFLFAPLLRAEERPRVRPVADASLLARAAAAHKLLRRGDVADGPLVLSYVVWPNFGSVLATGVEAA